MSIIPGFSPNLLGNLKRIEEYQALGQTEDSILERFEKKWCTYIKAYGWCC